MSQERALAAGPTPPRAARHPHPVRRHGETVDDPYHWLRAENWQQVMSEPEALDSEIRAYLEAEQTYTEAVLAPTRALQERLYQEMRARLPEDDAGVPAPDGAYAYYTRYVAGGEHPLVCRQPTAGEALEEVLIDGNAEAAEHAFYRLGGVAQSPDHRYLAYSVDTSGGEFHHVLIKEIQSGRYLDEGIADVLPTVVWANDSTTLYYTELDAHHRPCRVRRHRLGSDVAADEVVYEEQDPGFYIGLARSESRRLILISAHDHSSTAEVRFLDADRPDAAPVLIAARRSGLDYDVSEWQGRLLIRTNIDEAEDFKLVEAPLDQPSPENWRDLVPHAAGRLIIEFAVFRDWLVRRERVDGLPRIVVRNFASGEEHEVAFEEAAFSLTLDAGYEYATTTLRYRYSSPRLPEETVDYDMAHRTRVVRKRQRVPSGHDPERYVVTRLFATSHDGARVPVSILHLKDLELDGRAPVWLYGYGAYGISLPVGFEGNRLSLVDRGFVYAVAHVRGGMDLGYRWYADGKLEKKRNTFLDYIAAAEALIETGYGSAGNFVGHGRSAGGLLIGAVVNMRPELFRAVIAEVPFVDVLNTMSDADLPLTPPEWEEWGNPIDDAEAYRRLAGYCPYENVAAKAYPHILATGGLTDPRVTYWEPAKWIAKLRALSTDGNLKLLKMNMAAGHGGLAGRFERLRDQALIYAFALMVSGRAETSGETAPSDPAFAPP